jgi:signal transduction histidine kinase
MPFNQASEKQYRHAALIQGMLDASIHGIVLLKPVRDTDGTITDFTIEIANAAIEQQIGFKIDDTTRPLLNTYFPNNTRHGFTQTYIEALESGERQHRELYYEDEKLQGWFEIGVSPLDGFVVVTFVNITEAKHYQQRIEESATQLKAIMDIAQSGIFVFVPERDATGVVVDFRFLVANPSFAAYVGQTPETLIGDLASKWFPGYKTNRLFDLYYETYATGRTNRFDFHYDADGIDVWLDIMSTKLGNGVLVTFTDYTPVKKLQLELGALVQDLQRSNQSLEEFAYAASHDLQEPLRKIHFFSNRLKSTYESALGEEGAAMLERMEVASRRMRTLIDDLLAFSKVSAESTHTEDIDLYRLIQGILSDLETGIQEKGARITIEKLPRLNGDEAQLRQLFQNVIGNALKYSREGVPPEVNISSAIVKGRDAGSSLPQKDANKTYHQIIVNDNGVGFEQEYARKIFQLFQRLHGRSEYEGTGIGLAIVQKVIENHKGHIRAEGRPGQGATFEILLPA